MATTHTTRERTTDDRQASPGFASEEFNHRTYWLVVTAGVLGCAVIHAGVLLSAGLAAAYLVALIPGIAGKVVFFTVGLGLIGTAPEIGNRICIGFLEVLEPYRAE